jgi:soluble calcium-activated nucleotidase 1
VVLYATVIQILLNKYTSSFRRASKEIYTEAADETRGTDLLLIADETFNKIEVHHVGSNKNKARGFSAFQFVPDTKDQVIVALKSEEKDGKPIGSYLTVFNLDGHVLLDESKLNGAHKFEGIVFSS